MCRRVSGALSETAGALRREGKLAPTGAGAGGEGGAGVCRQEERCVLCQ